MSIEPTEVVTWVKVERPVFDLFGILVSSLTFATLAAALAFGLGAALGAFFIWRNRRHSESELTSLQLGDSHGS